MRKTLSALRFLLVFILMFVWVFSGWPQISLRHTNTFVFHVKLSDLEFPPEVEEAHADSTTKTYSFPSNSESWAATCTGGLSCSWASGDGSPANGSLEESETRKNKNTAWSWSLSSITWESLGVPSGGTVTSVDGSYNHSMVTCTDCNTSGGNTSGDLLIRNSADDTTIATLETAVSYTGTAAWTGRDASGTQSIGASYQASTTSIILRIAGNIQTNNVNGAAALIREDEIKLIITYTAPSVPTLQQNYFRWYENKDNILPDTTWSGLGENAAIGTANNPPMTGEELRLRVSVLVTVATLDANSQAFEIHWAEKAGGTCGGGDESFTQMPTVAACVAADEWCGFNNSGVTDGTSVSGDPPTGGEVLLSVSDRSGRYEEDNPSANNEFAVSTGEDVEYDWVITNNNAKYNQSYCFEMRETDDSQLNGGDPANFAELITAEEELTFTIDSGNTDGSSPESSGRGSPPSMSGLWVGSVEVGNSSVEVGNSSGTLEPTTCSNSTSEMIS